MLPVPERARFVWLVWPLLLLATVAGATEFYVAPNGSPDGAGTQASPWDLATALNEPSVRPGDTIWLRGGTYVGHFANYLSGTPGNPIIVRQYPGERATLDGNYGGNDFTLKTLGAYTWFWGFEITNSDPTRWSDDGNNPPRRGEGVDLAGDGNRLIHLIIHDTAEGILTTSADLGNEVTGCLIYYNGYDSPDRGHGHGVYAQNEGSVIKPVHDNIIFEQFGYGIHAYAEGGYLDHLEFIGNTSFSNGGLSQISGLTTNILVGGLRIANNPKLDSNFTYTQADQGLNNLGYSAGCTNPTVTNNYLDNSFRLIGCTGVTMTGNTFSGAVVGFDPSQYPDNTYYSSTPTGLKIFLRPSTYEPGRVHITVFNWDLQSTVGVDLSSVLSVGSSYEIRNAQDYFGAPVLTGTYDGNPVAIPMTGLTVASPVGVAAPPPSGPEFNVFVLTSTLGPDDFFDVPQANPFHDDIHTLAANDITAGCGTGYYCPDAAVSRAQMAVFLLKAEHGASYVPPPATGNVFSDVPASAFAAAWIENLEAEGVTSGCGGGKYCPSAQVTRAQLAVFLLKALLGSSYVPPSATGTVFTDVHANAFAAAWIEDLAARNVTSGCGGGNYCPAAPSTRGQMAVFLVRTFNLQ